MNHIHKSGLDPFIKPDLGPSLFEPGFGKQFQSDHLGTEEFTTIVGHDGTGGIFECVNLPRGNENAGIQKSFQANLPRLARSSFSSHSSVSIVTPSDLPWAMMVAIRLPRARRASSSLGDAVVAQVKANPECFPEIRDSDFHTRS